MSLDTVPGRLRRKEIVPEGPRARGLLRLPLAAALVGGIAWYSARHVSAQPGESVAADILPLPVMAVLTPNVLVASLILLLLSGFFSACETAYFSLNRVSLGKMRDSGDVLPMLAAKLMEHPGKLLASLLTGNTITNILLGVVLAGPSEEFFEKCLLLPATASFACALVSVTALVVFLGEIVPKVSVARSSEGFAAAVAAPLIAMDLVLAPLRDLALFLTGIFFKVTGLSKVAAAPYITDDEFLTVLHEGEASGAIERGERQMIQGILEFSEVMLKEVLVPRPDMVTLPQTATIAEAVALFREQEYARMPVYGENLDNIVGILYAKDLLLHAEGPEAEQPITPLLRKAHFVPETMTVAGFVKMAQRLRTHMAIVVDEYGGTEGLITLQDALREVVGDIGDDVEETAPGYTKLQEGVYRVDGSLSLHELEELTGMPFEDEEHTTVAGFLMDKTDKIPQVGDKIAHSGVQFTVERVEGKRVAQVRLQVFEETAEGAVR